MPESLVAGRADTHRWRVLAVVVAAQFMFVLDAFIVNVAIPSIRTELRAGTGEVQAVIALYQLAYACLVITGGRLGDTLGRRRVFLAGLIGFTLTSLWCGCARSAEELVLARVAQGAAAALMAPQVLATIHTLFPDAARAKAFAIFGMALGLGGGLGFVLGGWLLTADIGGLGWRTVFLVNGPIGLAIIIAAWKLMPAGARTPELRLDTTGAVLLFAALLALIGPLLIGQDRGWPLWLAGVEVAGIVLMADFVWWERRVARRGGSPLIDLSLMRDPGFRAGLGAACCLFAGNISFYLVVTLFVQGGLGATPLQAGLALLPLVVTFVLGARHGARWVGAHGISALVRGCWVQLAGVAVCALLVDLAPHPDLGLLAVALGVFGYGQGLVMAPLFGGVLAGVRHEDAGAGAGILATAQQASNGAGVALIGAVYVVVQRADGDRIAVLVACAGLAVLVCLTAVLLSVMRRAVQRAATPPSAATRHPAAGRAGTSG